MRIDCSIPGFEDCFVEFSTSWTRGDIKRFGTGETENYFEFIRSKIISLYIKITDGEVTSPEQLTEDAIDNMQWEVFQWFVVLPQIVVKEVLELGEAARRQLWLSVEEKKEASQQTT